LVPSAAGAVVLVPFPFTDLTQAKLRPAVALADAGRGDWILAQGLVKGTLREKSDISDETQPTHLMCGGLPACHADHGWMPPGSCTT